MTLDKLSPIPPTRFSHLYRERTLPWVRLQLETPLLPQQLLTWGISGRIGGGEPPTARGYSSHFPTTRKSIFVPLPSPSPQLQLVVSPRHPQQTSGCHDRFPFSPPEKWWDAFRVPGSLTPINPNSRRKEDPGIWRALQPLVVIWLFLGFGSCQVPWEWGRRCGWCFSTRDRAYCSLLGRKGLISLCLSLEGWDGGMLSPPCLIPVLCR